jgi:ribonuclease BN (tRNA processing enzyme)
VAATPLPLPVSLAPVTEIAADDEREIAGFRVTSRETPHAPEVIAAARRLEGAGRSIVYTGDTQANPEMLVPLSRGADVLIHEAYCRETLERQAESMPSPRGAGFLNGIRSTHTEVEDAARIAAAAGVRILVLTHLLAHEDAALLASRAATHFPGEIVAACDGLVLETA